MLVLLRIIAVVGLIFWFSPLRQPSERERAEGARGAPPKEAVAVADIPDTDRIGRLIQAWEMLSPGGRAAALDGIAGRLPDIGGHAPKSATDIAGTSLPPGSAMKTVPAKTLGP
jgi:hypothetical protein